MAETKQRRVFRNASQRIFYLKRRPHQASAEANFVVAQGQTVEPLDEQEELLLASLSDFRDVAKETPALGNQMDDLTKQLAEARAENAKLTAEKKELEAQAQLADKANKGRPSKK